VSPPDPGAPSAYEDARRHYHESLAIRAAMKNKEGIASCLEGLAAVAAAMGELARAARLFGAAEARRQELGASLPPAERADHESQVAAVSAALGQPAFAAAWAEGSALPLDQAITEAAGGEPAERAELPVLPSEPLRSLSAGRPAAAGPLILAARWAGRAARRLRPVR
jgi:hypothetical protein